MLHAGKWQRGVSVAAAGTKLQGNAADKHDGSQSAKTAGVNAERNRRYENNECFVCCKQGHKQNGTAPKASRARRGKTVMARATARPPSSSSSSSNPQAVALSIPRAKPPGRPLRLPPLWLELVGKKTASKAVDTGTEPAAPAASTQKDDDYV